MFYYLAKLSGYLYFVRYWTMCIAIVSEPGCDVMSFKINLIFLIKPFFLYDQKVVTKT